MRSGKTMMGGAAAGEKQVLLKRRGVGAKRMRETFAYQVLPDLQGKGLAGKEAFSMTSAFGYFWRVKSN